MSSYFDNLPKDVLGMVKDYSFPQISIKTGKPSNPFSWKHARQSTFKVEGDISFEITLFFDMINGKAVSYDFDVDNFLDQVDKNVPGAPYEVSGILGRHMGDGKILIPHSKNLQIQGYIAKKYIEWIRTLHNTK